MNRQKGRNWGLVLLSGLLAVVLWIYVTNEQTSIPERAYEAVPIQVRGLAAHLAVTGSPGTVNLRLQGSQEAIAELGTRPVEVFVDVSRFSAGRVSVPVQVKVPEGITVTDLRPNQVYVNIEKIEEKQVPVKAAPTGTPAAGFRVLDIGTRPDAVILHGPHSIINRIKEVEAAVDVRGRNTSFRATVPVTMIDDAGHFVESRAVRHEPALVDVMVTIGRDVPSKKVVVRPNLTGIPAPGYNVTMTVVDPAELTLTGEAKILSVTEQVYTQPVDVSNASRDLLVTVGPQLPDGLAANRQEITVRVKIGQE